MSCEYLSREWLTFTGCEAGEDPGAAWSRSIHADDLPRWLDACLHAFDTREPFEIEYRLRRRDGEYRWVLERGEPRYGEDGRFCGFIGACMEIEERKRAEDSLLRALERERVLRSASEEASRLRDGFLASVLIELRTPVQAIAACAAKLRGALVQDDGARAALEAIEQNARAQERTICTLLELAGDGSAAAEPGERRSPLLAGLRVLVVDGDAQARDSVTRVLAMAGAETRAAATPVEALEALPAFRPDVLLSALGARAEDAYAVTLTREAARERALAAGVDAQLAKPVEPVALLATVSRLAHARL